MAVFFVFQIGEDEEKCQLFPWETNDRSKAEKKEVIDLDENHHHKTSSKKI